MQAIYQKGLQNKLITEGAKAFAKQHSLKDTAMRGAMLQVWQDRTEVVSEEANEWCECGAG